jgi:type VI secretion system secreted protein Hcp
MMDCTTGAIGIGWIRVSGNPRSRLKRGLALRRIRLLVTSAIVSIFAALGVVAPAEAAVDYFLEVNGVPGESHDSKFAKSIDVFSYSWAGSANSEKKGNKVNLSDLNVSKRVDVASPALFQRLVQGTTIPSVELIGRKAGESQLVFLRYCLQDVRVTSIQQSGSSGEDFSQENVSFGYAAFSQQYTPQDAKGGGLPSVFAGWNSTTGDLIATYPDPCGL